ncbi:MAG: hypothetical protein INR71_13595 [Terriglobus roseus]|nr:hypothetical protein [Terriglobus roseus]
MQAPQLLVEPSTPTTATAAPAEVDSPLRNPRSAPQPPAFKVIPPTPFSEIEDPLAAAQALQSAQAPRPPARRISLMQRARRYSDSFLQPLFVRTVSVKRVMRPATGDEAATRDRNLHPQWRPRGFWDDFSDSESEDDDWFGDGEYVVDSDDLDRPPRRLPRGGDTSDVRSLEQEQERTAMSAGSPAAVGRMGSVKKVIMDSFRGSGGFLIGNSLGVERAGTNRRRHHISLPTRLQARYAPNRGVATLPAHVTERYGAAGAAHHFVARQQQVEQQQRQQDGQQAILQDVQANGTIPRSAENGFTHNPTQPLSLRSVPRSNAKRGLPRSKSLSSFRSYTTSATDASRGNPRGGWRRSGIRFPFRVEYVGIRGVAERMRERKAERRREELRRRIGRGYLQGVS